MFRDLARKYMIKINESDWEMANSYTLIVEELLNKAIENEEDSKDRWRRQLEKDIPELERLAHEIQDIIETD